MTPPANKFKRAVGLSYDGGESEVPSLSVKGELLDADNIVAIAHRFGIPVIEKPAIVKALSLFETGSSIPEDLFKAVALILAEVERETESKGSNRLLKR